MSLFHRPSKPLGTLFRPHFVDMQRREEDWPRLPAERILLLWLQFTGHPRRGRHGPSSNSHSSWEVRGVTVRLHGSKVGFGPCQGADRGSDQGRSFSSALRPPEVPWLPLLDKSRVLI